PLGAAVIGGTITSTILTLIVVPTVYEIFDTMRTRLAVRFRGAKASVGHDAPTTGDGGAVVPA
ncbi:MAG TPA: hypothetical protein VF576_05050, partial [Rubricoccaceae bacterium]